MSADHLETSYPHESAKGLYYSSKDLFTGGKTVRDWLSTKSFKEQFEFGKRQLEKFGTVTLEDGK